MEHMDPLEEQLTKLNLLNSTYLPAQATPALNTAAAQAEYSQFTRTGGKTVSSLPNGSGSRTETVIDDGNAEFTAVNTHPAVVKSPKKVGPIVPPKPHKKKQHSPEVPQSCLVKQACEPLYSKRLQSSTVDSATSHNVSARVPILHRKPPVFPIQNVASNVTLDNPAVLEQQLEALAHHKKQLERKGLLLQQRDDDKLSAISYIPKLSSNSLVTADYSSGVIYSNLRPVFNELNASASPPSVIDHTAPDTKITEETNIDSNIYKNTKSPQTNPYVVNKNCSRNLTQNHMATLNADKIANAKNNIYSNLMFEKDNQDKMLPPPPSDLSIGTVQNVSEYLIRTNDEEILPPPSPVSSSYSELRRATDVFSKKPYLSYDIKGNETSTDFDCNEGDIDNKSMNGSQRQTYTNMNYNNEFDSYCPTLQSSSTYESIYEPINPRPPSQLSTQSNYLTYAPYVNGPQLNTSGSGGNISTICSISASGCTTPSYPSIDASNSSINSKVDNLCGSQQKEIEVEALTDFLVHSLDTGNDCENYGMCFKCNERVLGENSGCTAMDQIYHISCFTCSQCQINLQGKPFYALDNKPFCEFDYLQTLEKCSVCMKPILERILRATGKPYHPQCFTCIVCGNSLDGIPFTVDATNQNYCISDFHKKFAPRCCVCKEPIMPEPGEEETVRVVALDRSFHFECYKCEDCGLLLSSEAEGRGCYPLDGHVLCKGCNAKRVQMLTNRMTTEL